MSFISTEERVDSLEALLGEYMKQCALTEMREREWNAKRDADTAKMKADTAAMKADTVAMKADTAAMKISIEDMKASTEAFKIEMRAGTAAMQADTEAFKVEMRQARKEMNKQWGDLANRLGTIVEDILAPNLRRLAREHFAIAEIIEFSVRRERRIAGTEREGEFDTIVVGADAVILGEAKSQATDGYCSSFAKKVKTFFDFHPELKGKKLFPVFGCWSIPDKIVKHLTSLGIYAMQMGEHTMELTNAAAVDKKLHR